MTNPETIRVLGWCLLHFVWQGAVLALVLCALLSRLRSPQWASKTSTLPFQTGTSPAQEDERDLARVTMQFPMFEALLRSYLSTASDFLTRDERRHLVFAGKLITFEIGLRFLTDFLAGDTYFKVHREGHNLDRCRAQFKLVESIEQQEEKMNKLAEAIQEVTG